MRSRAWALVLVLLPYVAGCDAPRAAVVTPDQVHETAYAFYDDCVPSLDLLLVVDDGPAMADEEEAVVAELPRFLATLGTGDADGDGRADFAAVREVRIGVTTGDLGVGGLTDVPSCATGVDLGDDGVLLPLPVDGAASCGSYHAGYAWFEHGSADSDDVACVARTSTNACSVGQPLEASLKALLPSTSAVTFYAGTRGHGDDPSGDPHFVGSSSILVVLDVSTGDDCSTDVTDLWNPASTEHVGASATRCARYQGELYPVSRYVDGLRSLRPREPARVIFAAVAGVPQDLVAGEVDYDRVFADPRMTPTVVRDGAGERLRSVCATRTGVRVTPGARLASVARAFGREGVLGSACAADYGAVFAALTAKVARAAGPGYCTWRTRARDASTGLVPCRLEEWFLPGDGGPTTCADVPGAEPSPLDGDLGEVGCVIAQLPTDASTGAPLDPAASGWYYDDASDAAHDLCGGGPRIGFAAGGRPPVGVAVRLVCLEATAPAP